MKAVPVLSFPLFDIKALPTLESSPLANTHRLRIIEIAATASHSPTFSPPRAAGPIFVDDRADDRKHWQDI